MTQGQLNFCKGLVPVTYVEIIEDLKLEHSDTVCVNYLIACSNKILSSNKQSVG